MNNGSNKYIDSGCVIINSPRAFDKYWNIYNYKSLKKSLLKKANLTQSAITLYLDLADIIIDK